MTDDLYKAPMEDEPRFNEPPRSRPRRPGEKPTSAMVFGIFNIIWGSIGFIVVLFTIINAFVDFKWDDSPQPPATFTLVNTAIYAAMTVWIFVSGLKLVRFAPGCRQFFVTYCAVSLVVRAGMAIAQMVIMMQLMEEALQQEAGQMSPAMMENFIHITMIVSSIFLLIFVSAYELVGLIVMSRRRAKAIYAEVER